MSGEEGAAHLRRPRPGPAASRAPGLSVLAGQFRAPGSLDPHAQWAPARSHGWHGAGRHGPCALPRSPLTVWLFSKKLGL